MATAPLENRPDPVRFTVDRYFELVKEGLLSEDDRVELLEGVVVAMTPSNPPHASAVGRVGSRLDRALHTRAVVRLQCTFVAGSHSAPEPDVAVVPGSEADYDRRHPTSALLVVEIADWSLQQDRLTKAAIYAGAGIPDYWILNLRNRSLEVRRDPSPETGRYATSSVLRAGDVASPLAVPDVELAVSDLLPAPDPDDQRT